MRSETVLVLKKSAFVLITELTLRCVRRGVNSYFSFTTTIYEKHKRIHQLRSGATPGFRASTMPRNYPVIDRSPSSKKKDSAPRAGSSPSSHVACGSNFAKKGRPIQSGSRPCRKRSTKTFSPATS